jgi:hypothetical protein
LSVTGCRAFQRASRFACRGGLGGAQQESRAAPAKARYDEQLRQNATSRSALRSMISSQFMPALCFNTYGRDYGAGLEVGDKYFWESDKGLKRMGNWLLPQAGFFPGNVSA